MTNINIDLLLEAARLLKRYPLEDWENLVTALREESTRTRLVELAESMYRISVQNKQRKRRKSKPRSIVKQSLIKELEKIAQTDPQKSQILKQFRDSLLSRQLFSSTKQLRDFASLCGLKISSEKSKRQKIINDLLRFMMGLTVKEIESKLSSFPPAREDPLGQEYERWVRIILGREVEGK